MLLGNTALVEIVAAFQDGISTGTDVSQKIREIELEVDSVTGKLELTQAYLLARGRGGEQEFVLEEKKTN
jgi:hypothetical protein